MSRSIVILLSAALAALILGACAGKAAPPVVEPPRGDERPPEPSPDEEPPPAPPTPPTPPSPPSPPSPVEPTPTPEEPKPTEEKRPPARETPSRRPSPSPPSDQGRPSPDPEADVTAGAEDEDAGEGEEQPEQPPTPVRPPPKPEAKKLEYERILGTFALDPEAAILLSPAVVERHLDKSLGDRGFETLVRDFAAAGHRRGEAAGRLNWGALLWANGDHDDAYRQIMRAQALFAELGDVDGLAHVYEWLGWCFHQSGEDQRASEHLSVAYRLFETLENAAACERVLGYVER